MRAVTMKKESLHETSIFMVFFIWVVLILLHLNAIVAMEAIDEDRQTSQQWQPSISSTQKSIRFNTVGQSSSRLEDISPAPFEGNGRMFYDEDKRIVHTGPNPLHN
uniref:CLAVATA3/ESR (CLE)-related protein 17 n=1 Tax=Opuntia streptacantha TaxID=393608 RepID=A0A7C9DPQ5_OPUST